MRRISKNNNNQKKPFSLVSSSPSLLTYSTRPSLTETTFSDSKTSLSTTSLKSSISMNRLLVKIKSKKKTQTTKFYPKTRKITHPNEEIFEKDRKIRISLIQTNKNNKNNRIPRQTNKIPKIQTPSSRQNPNLYKHQRTNQFFYRRRTRKFLIKSKRRKSNKVNKKPSMNPRCKSHLKNRSRRTTSIKLSNNRLKSRKAKKKYSSYTSKSPNYQKNKKKGFTTKLSLPIESLTPTLKDIRVDCPKFTSSADRTIVPCSFAKTKEAVSEQTTTFR